jgi:hypothetical protein
MLMQLLVGCERCCTTREDLPETMQEFVALCGHDIDLFELLWRKGFLRAHASWYGEGPSRQSLRIAGTRAM